MGMKKQGIEYMMHYAGTFTSQQSCMVTRPC